MPGQVLLSASHAFAEFVRGLLLSGPELEEEEAGRDDEGLGKRPAETEGGSSGCDGSW